MPDYRRYRIPGGCYFFTVNLLERRMDTLVRHIHLLREAVRVARHERAIWQRRFWKHAIRDEGDYARHIDYIHYNPVKHGLVQCVKEWPHSTFHRYVKNGVYPENWAGGPESDLETGERV